MWPRMQGQGHQADSRALLPPPLRLSLNHSSQRPRLSSGPSGPPACLAEDPTVGGACGVPELRNGRWWAGSHAKVPPGSGGASPSLLGVLEQAGPPSSWWFPSWGRGKKARGLESKGFSEARMCVCLACWQDSSPEGTAARALCRAHWSQVLSNEGTSCFSSPLAFLETGRRGIPARNLVPKCLGHQPNALVAQRSWEGSSSGGKWPCGAEGMSLGTIIRAALDSGQG